VREFDSFGAGGPAGPSFYLAPGVFLNDVMGGIAEQWEDFVEYCPLQGWLVSLDGHQVVQFWFPADVLRSFALGVRGVEGDEG